MMIEDEDLRSLYQVTSAGRIEALEAGLLAPNFSPDAAQLETLRREAHSLKGDARVMGLEAIAGLAQQIEAALKSVQQGEIDPSASWSPPLTDCLEHTLQTIDKLVAEATTGTPAEVDVQAMSDRLKESLMAVNVSTSNTSATSNTSPSAASRDTGADIADDIGSDIETGTAVRVTTQIQETEPEKIVRLDDQRAFIADEEMRSLYRTIANRRVQAIAFALAQINAASEAGHPKTGSELGATFAQPLMDFRHEVHGLKGDSLAVGVEPVATIMTQFEAIANSLSSQAIALTPPLSYQLNTGLQLTQQLIAQAVTQTPTAETTVDPTLLTQLLDDLAALMAEGSQTNDPLAVTTALIEDEELCEVYRTTSENRLQLLEGVLSQLEADPLNKTAITTMRQETHSLKGDALSIGAEPIAVLATTFEMAVRGIEHDEMALTPTLSNSLRQSLIAISQLVQTATTGTPNNVNVTQVEQNLLDSAAQAVAIDLSADLGTNLNSDASTDASANASVDVSADASETVANRDAASSEAASSEIASSNTDINGTVAEPERSVVPIPEPTTTASTIEDAELREVYRVATEERLERLEQGLVQIERQPTGEMFAEMLREAHSLKGDARSVGLDTIGSLSHAVEDILIGLRATGKGPAPEVSEALYQGLDAIAQLADEAVTGKPSTLTDTEQLLRSLRDNIPTADIDFFELEATTPSSATGTGIETVDLPTVTTDSAASTEWVPAPEPLPTAPTAPTEAPFRLETIRVQARDLDILAEQTEQLTLTRIQNSQTTGQVIELAALWEKWQTHRNYQQLQAPSSPETTVNPYEKQLDTLINALRLSAQENSFKLDLISQDLGKQVQTLRLLPVANIFRPFPRLVRDLARQQSKTVELVTEGEETTADKRILEEIQDSVMHLIRNALDHGIETAEERERLGKPPTATLSLRSYQTATSLIIEVADDGRGLDIDAIKQTALKRKLYSPEALDQLSENQVQDLVFTPGFSTRSFTTEISGRGVGLDVVRNQVERLKGNVQIESSPGQGCTFRIQISTQLTTVNVVFINTRGVTHALPIEYLQTTLRVAPEDIISIDDREMIVWGDRNIPVVELFDVLELAHSPAYRPPTERPLTSQRACLILTVGDEMGAFFVDRLLDTQEVVFKPQSALLKRVRNVSGSTILGNGAICTILNPPDLVKSIQRAGLAKTTPPEDVRRQSVILLVEDSPLVRIQEKRLFENAGYEVVTAEDGLEGYKLLRKGNFDAVISDIEMPNLDGLALTTKIRNHGEYDELPIILVTTLSSDRDRKRGADAGANAYIVKGKFNQEALLETLQRLI